MVKKLQKILFSNSWPPIRRNLTVYDSLQQNIIFFISKSVKLPCNCEGVQNSIPGRPWGPTNSANSEAARFK